MKLISWDAGYPSRGRDAVDFQTIAENYLDAGNDERLWGDASNLVTAAPFDRRLTGARLPGRDMSRLAERKARSRAANMLDLECDTSGRLSLITDIARSGVNPGERDTEILELLRSVRLGFAEGGSLRAYPAAPDIL
jgi:predicted nucleotidyltransferase